MDVARVSNKLQGLVINVYLSVERPSQIPQVKIDEFDQRVKGLETIVEKAGVPHTQVFKCIQDYHDCMAAAKDDSGRWLCRVGVSACIGERFTKFVD